MLDLSCLASYRSRSALDRVLTTTYPDGKAYNAVTQPVSLSMASGALPRITVGNGVATTHTCNFAEWKSTELGT